MRWNMDLCILCKRCLTNIHFILLYVDPKKSSFFFSKWERERKLIKTVVRCALSLFLYFLTVNFDSFQKLPFLLFCRINKKECLYHSKG